MATTMTKIKMPRIIITTKITMLFLLSLFFVMGTIVAATEDTTTTTTTTTATATTTTSTTATTTTLNTNTIDEANSNSQQEAIQKKDEEEEEEEHETNDDNDDNVVDNDNNNNLPVYYKCPIEDDETMILSLQRELERISSWNQHTDYANAGISNDILYNMTNFLQTFRTVPFDTYNQPYNEYKQAMTDFKVKYFNKYLLKQQQQQNEQECQQQEEESTTTATESNTCTLSNNNSNNPNNNNKSFSIYESATGIGMNLLLTLELIYESSGIQDIYVYGNEYIDISTIKANMLLQTLSSMASSSSESSLSSTTTTSSSSPSESLSSSLPRFHVGKICTSNSMELSTFVPSNSFDIVYTGYISPNINPLNFQFGTQNDHYGRYRELCESSKEDIDSQRLLHLAQNIQNDWFGQWVYQMTRIAKPGGAVIIEQVSVPYCDCYIDWGGVTQQFWYDSAKYNIYDWNVNPNTIVIELDTLHLKRYHVVMEKL